MINLSVPNLKGNEALYIQECIDTEWVSSVGKYVEVFEERITKYTGSKFAVACASGTSALHLSLIVSGVCPNDEVLVPTMTFIATPNSVSYLNAVPVFMDCDEFYNIDVKKVINFIKGHTYTKLGFTYNKNTNRRIMAIIPVHVSGNAVDLDSLVDICNERNIKIIENGGWHFSYFLSPEEIANKINSSPHKEFINDENLNVEIIKKRIKNLKDPLGRDKEYKKLENLNILPKEILDNHEFYKKWFC